MDDRGSLTTAATSYTLRDAMSTSEAEGPSAPALESWGHALHRPECVLATPAGDVFVSDWRGGVTVIRQDGSQHTWLARSSGVELRPNGVALAPDGTFLIAHLGGGGGVWRLDQDGILTPFLIEVDGLPLPPANFVTVDEGGRTWISVSTRHHPRQLAWRADVADGFVVLVDDRGARIVADGLHYTNEVRPDPSGRWLYVVETFGRRLIRFGITSDAALHTPETVATFGHGCFPDGFAFDQAGGVWVTSLVSNRLLRVRSDEPVETVIEEANADHVQRVERAFASGRMNAGHLGPIPGTRLQHLTSIAFGGADRRTAYLGSLHASCVYRFRTGVAGAPSAHWSFTLP
jgi:sugar lactone lactonase YvrE